MVEIRPSRPDEVQIQKELWQAAFGDDPRYIDWFYQCCWRPEDTSPERPTASWAAAQWRP